MQVAEKRRGPDPPWDESLEWVRIGRGEFWRPVDSITNGPGHSPFRNQCRGAGAVFTRVRKVERGGLVNPRVAGAGNLRRARLLDLRGYEKGLISDLFI